ncbi:hypothetical protein OSTOST_02411 [Ostertagia ostertagi]
MESDMRADRRVHFESLTYNIEQYESTQYELHTFVDASARAYATVAYLRLISHQGKITSAIVMARQRLAPIHAKTMTIPRLELLALLIGRFTGSSTLDTIPNEKRSIRGQSLHGNQRKNTIMPKDEELPEREVQANSTIFINTSLKQFSSALLTKFSNLKTLRHTTVIILTFLKLQLYDKFPKDTQDILATKLPEVTKITVTIPVTLLQAQAIEIADQLLVKLMQRSLTRDDRRKWDHLGLHKDENDLLRCRGRLKAKYLTRDIREPILLLPDQQLITLIIQHTHERCGHQSGRQIVRKCLQRCLSCKRWNGKPYYHASFPPLPSARVQPTRPFSYIGIDLAGPYKVTDSGNNKNKRWICLKTCMTTRAVYLEVVNDLTALQLIHVLRRFISRRGRPQLIISDNATNFNSPTIL